MLKQLEDVIAEIEKMPEYFQARVVKKIWTAVHEERTDWALVELESKERSREGWDSPTA